ncbi:MAG: hypothetical protein NT112_00760 [Methanoregula sp.]|nr:hypothetical protein [Methanoregula sp.]
MAEASLPFIAFSVLILFIIGILLLIAGKKRKQQHVSPQAMPGILLIILGIVLRSDRIIGYEFLGAGVIIAIFDAVKNRQKK